MGFVAWQPQEKKELFLAAYHFTITVRGSFEKVVDKTKQALADHAFGIVSEIDMSAVLAEKLGVDQDPYLILGACNPGFAHEVVAHEPSVGVLLPCNVVVRAIDDGRVTVDFMDPAVMIGLVGEQKIVALADEVRTRLEMTRDAIAAA